MSSPAEKLLADLSGAFGEEAVRAAVMGFQGSGGSMTPSMVTKCMAAVMASYKNVLLQILSSYYGPWDCQFARDVLLGVEFEFERSGVAEAMLPFVSDLDNFERIVIKEGCPGLASYAVSNLMEQVREEEARRQGGTPEGATNTGGGTLEDGGDGSAIFVPPTTNSNPTGTMQVVNAQTDELQVPVVQSAVPVQNTMTPNLSSTAPVLTPVASPYSSFNGQTQMPLATATAVPAPVPQLSVAGQQQQQQQQVCVQIPYNVRAGQVIQARAPSGQTFSVRVPANTPPGSTIVVAVPQSNTSNVIQPARPNVAVGNAASGNAVLSRRIAETRRRQKIIRIISAIVFFVILGQIIGGILGAADFNSHNDSGSSDVTDSGNFVIMSGNAYSSCMNAGHSRITSEEECLEAVNEVDRYEHHSTVDTFYPDDKPPGCYLDTTNHVYGYNSGSTHHGPETTCSSSTQYACICKTW